MLSIDLVHEINRLLRTGELSQRQIAARLQVSRGTVGAIASGRRGLNGKEDADQVPKPKTTRQQSMRCRHCGYRVYPPCRICIAREDRRQQLAEMTLVSNPTKRRKRPCRVGSRTN
jgi:hypothetical protein